MTNNKAQMHSLIRPQRAFVGPKYRLSEETIDRLASKSLGDPEWAEICDLLVTWWEEARRQKHRNNAVWTDRAFELSAKVVYNMYAGSVTGKAAALELVEDAYAAGWQGIKKSYSSFSSQSNAVQPVFQL